MKQAALLLLVGPYLVAGAPQYRGGQGRRLGRQGGGNARRRLGNVRQNQVGRRVPVIPEYEEEDQGEELEYEPPSRYTEGQQSGYGYTRDSNEYFDRRAGSNNRGSQRRGENYNRGSGEEDSYRNRATNNRENIEEILEAITEGLKEEVKTITEAQG